MGVIVVKCQNALASRWAPREVGHINTGVYIVLVGSYRYLLCWWDAERSLRKCTLNFSTGGPKQDQHAVNETYLFSFGFHIGEKLGAV